MKPMTFLAPLLATALSSFVGLAAEGGSAGRSTLQNASDQRTGVMKIRIWAGDKTVTATLADNPTSRDFVSLLPLAVTLEDHAATEKIAYLPRKLSTDGAPAGSTPTVGDVAYYAPWGNLALFKKDFSYSSGLVPLGRIDTGLETLGTTGSLRATIELVGP